MFSRRQHEQRSDRQSELDLYRDALQGSGEAMSALYRRHGPLVYRFTLRMSQNPSVAEEVTQEVFLALLRQPERFNPQRAELSTWLCGIARNQLSRHLERNQRFVPLESEDEVFDMESPDDDPADCLTRKEAIEAVRQGLEELYIPLREVIVLCELEELTYEQTSLILAIPVGTVRSRLHRAKVRLARLLRPVVVNTDKERLR